LLTEDLQPSAVKGHFKKRGASWYYWVELERGPGTVHALDRRRTARNHLDIANDEEAIADTLERIG